MYLILLHGLCAALYAGLAVYFWNTRWRIGGTDLSAGQTSYPVEPKGFRWWERGLLAAVVVFHALLLVDAILGDGQIRFGFAHALSMMALLALIFYGVESLVHPLEGMPALGLPPAAISVVLPALFGGASIMANAQSPAFVAHLLIAMLAYAFVAIAAAHAVLMAVIDRRMHFRRMGGLNASVLSGLPPLLTMERLLFQMLWAGFGFLSLTVVSGVMFSEEIFGRALVFDHKTVFGLVSWGIFAILLFGRAAYGWRGRTALNGTFAGFTALLLAYVGSRFVLEVMLGRL